MSRFRLVLVWGWASLAVPLAGCSDSWNAGPLQYIDNEALTKELKGKPNLAGKPVLQDRIRKVLAAWFGDSPQQIKVPPGSGLPEGGLYLASYMQAAEGAQAKYYRLYEARDVTVPMTFRAADNLNVEPQVGGYALYRRNCLHCHGVSGAGDGPTAPFLYPRPRDYRRGLFKFTSTPYAAPPHRSDLRRTISYGLHGTSMPAFHSLMTESEIEQVIDYVIFLSMRGKTELDLIEVASVADEKDPNALSDEIIKETVDGVINKWKQAQSQVVNPPVARTPPSRESIIAGRNLFLQSDCKDCHGTLAMGDGTSFVSQDYFNEVVFGGNPSEMQARVDQLPAKVKEMWDQKPDEWGNPLRPANLNRPFYKGGRRPIDIYWRIAKGINGAQMPGHYPALNEKQIWDLVNFVLALPYERELLTERLPLAPSPAHAAGAGQRSGNPDLRRTLAFFRFAFAVAFLGSAQPRPGSFFVRYWSVLFGLAAIFSVLCFVYAPFSPDWWMPLAGDSPHVISTFGREIDSLYIIILWITGIVFIGTQIVFVWASYRYADERDAAGRPVRQAQYFHGSQRLEVIWTIVPAAILVFIALYQMGTWAAIKFRSSAPRVPALAEITARQFQWVIRYPGPDAKLNTQDDLFTVNDLHFVRNRQVLIYLKSSDVLHSFYLPILRIKQDAVPGMTIPVWFDSDTAGHFELVCAELCGWGHYKMRGRVTIHENDADFQRWADQELAEQNRSQLSMTTGGDGR